MRFFMLRWLGRTPESFMPGSTADAKRTALTFAGADQRNKAGAIRDRYEARNAHRNMA